MGERFIAHYSQTGVGARCVNARGVGVCCVVVL